MRWPDREAWKTAFKQRLAWAALSLVTFPVGHWLFAKLLPGPTTIPKLVAVLLLLAVVSSWFIWEQRTAKRKRGN
jgi:hypothetical protein